MLTSITVTVVLKEFYTFTQHLPEACSQLVSCVVVGNFPSGACEDRHTHEIMLNGAKISISNSVAIKGESFY